MSGGLSIWVIYDHPKDYPDKFVARCWVGLVPTGSIVIADDLEKVRDTMVEMGLVKLMRTAEDDPAILETWL